MKTPDYLSYDRYKTKKQSAPKHRLGLFIGTFIVSLIVFLAFAKVMAPDVDVTIGDESEFEEKNIGLGVKQFVDHRLKSIDLEDLGKVSLNREHNNLDGEDISDVTEEKINLPQKKKEVDKENEYTPAPVVHKQDEPAVMPAYEAPRPDKKEIYMPVETTSMVKVYVGKYSTRAQADVAKDILMDSGMDVSPFVKNINGIYTLQIGSFSDKARAEQIAKDLTKNGFPARMVKE